jgi:hypothetical protein
MSSEIQSPFSRFAQGTRDGIAVAATEVTLTGQVLNYMKNMKQLETPISRNPLHWYKGYCTHLGSMAPITAMQMAAKQVFAQHFSSDGKRDLSLREKLIVAAAAGTAAAPMATATEMIILHQQKDQKFTGIIREISRLNGLRGFLTGNTIVTGRDAFFVTGYAAGGPAASQAIQERTSCSKNTADVSGSVLVGGVTSLITHPLDSVKRLLQDDALRSDGIKTVPDACRSIFNDGWKTAWKGGSFRTARVASFILIFTKVDESLRSS